MLVSLPYETSIFIGDREGWSQRGGGGRVREGPGFVIVHYMQLIYIYKYLNIFIDYKFKYNQQINPALVRNRTDISMLFK